MRFFKTLLCLAVLMPFIGCKNNENQEITLTSDKECVVVGNIKGLKNGRIELEDEFDGYQVIAEGKIRNGKFIIRTEVSHWNRESFLSAATLTSTKTMAPQARYPTIIGRHSGRKGIEPTRRRWTN